MSEFNKDMPEKMLGNSKKPFENERDERMLVNKKKKNSDYRTIRIHAEDHKQLRVAAAQTDMALIDIFGEAIDMWMNENEIRVEK